MTSKTYEIKPIVDDDRDKCLSNDNFLHGVTEVTKGERFTVAIWYTQDYAHIEV